MSNGKDKKKLKKHEFTPQQLREIAYARERLAREVKARQEGKQEYGAYGKREREPEIRPKKKENITDRIKRASAIQKEALKNVKKRMEVETPDVYLSKNRNWRKLTQDEKDDMYGRRQGTISMIKERSGESSPEEEKLVAENLRLKKLEAKKAWKEYRLKKRKKTAKKKKTTKTLARRPALPH